MEVNKEEFEAWKDNPITREVDRALVLWADKLKSDWMQRSWEEGSADALLLADLRARAEQCADLVDLNFETLEMLMEAGNE